MSGETGLEDASLIDLFRSEVETHSELLSSALLALERAPGDTSRIDEMMRAAHSIKGAARIVGVEPAVSVAHVMEDCFVAAQKKAIALSPGDIDVLLRGVDLLGQISSATRDPNLDLAQEFSGRVQDMVGQLQGVLSGSPRPQPVASKTEQAAVAAASTAPESPVPAKNEVTIEVPEILDRVAAENIRQQLLAAVEAQHRIIRFDLGATRDLDVQGLSLLAAIPAHLAMHSGAALQVARISNEMASVLRVTGLARHFGVRPELMRRAE
jgi:two-component system sensor histidine kinase and response regulator WspE